MLDKFIYFNSFNPLLNWFGGYFIKWGENEVFENHIKILLNVEPLNLQNQVKLIQWVGE